MQRKKKSTRKKKLVTFTRYLWQLTMMDSLMKYKRFIIFSNMILMLTSYKLFGKTKPNKKEQATL